MVIQEAANIMGKPQPERKHRLKHRFEVSKRLGQGTYGKVQLAINKETGQEVAIKTIKKSKIESEQDLVRIRREIQIMSSIQHPHIIHIYEVFENKDKIVLVMQYASGGELYDYLSDKKAALQDAEARRLFRQVAAAVYYCHKNKICHRDLKLENVLLDERGNAKIADFGLSNVFDERHLLGTFCGSPLYASPEIVKGTPYYGPEVDCWSMGVLLFTLVYGAMPFDGSNFKRLAKQISDGDYNEPKKKSEASSLIRRLLTVSPVKRANILDICTDWWVNKGYEHSLLQVSEDMANLTPVRLDLLLALAPSSPTPPGDDASSRPPETHPLDQNEDAPETSSNSFAFISDGMASGMDQIRAENPDDIFHENEEGSDDEFLSADAAAALEEGLLDQGGEKRPAEKSFDGSMVRVSSMAHKTKKPRKSNSVQKPSKSQAVLESPVEEERIVESAFATQDIPPKSVEESFAIQPEDITSISNPADALSTSLPSECVSADVTLEQETTVIPCDFVAGSSPSSDAQTLTAPTEYKTAKECDSVVSDASASPPKEKKIIKRKIVSSKKTASEKTAKDNSDAKTELANDPDKTKLKTSRDKSPVKFNKDRSPVKSSPEKTPPKSCREMSPSKSRESPRRSSVEPKERKSSMDGNVRRPSPSPKASSRRPSVESGETGRRPSLEPKDSPRKSSVELKESPRKSSLDMGKPPKKAELPKPAEKPKPGDKNSTAASRRPGKLVIPKFLESPQSTPSPKTGEYKKLVIPIRSVSDAKKAFENKSKTNPPSSKITESRKSSDSQLELKNEVESISKVVDETATDANNAKDEISNRQIKTLEEEAQQVSLEPRMTDTFPDVLPVRDVVFSDTKTDLENVYNAAPPSLVDDEMKKSAAKSILKKSIAKARLTERKLSQQSSMDSDHSSSTPPVVSSPVIGKVPNLSYLKIPKPYVKEDTDQTIKSEAKITLNEKPESPVAFDLASTEVCHVEPEEETIWGMPLSSPTAQQLKSSVLSTSMESDMNNWRQEVEESLKRLSPEGASEEPEGSNSLLETELSGEAVPTPIARSYKKFTFNKDGTCTTETGKIYTKPENNGSWTKVEKSTKVTTQPGGSLPEIAKAHREASPLHHSDSQSSSGSNDIFDDIFDSWTGDTMFGKLMKMNSMFGRLSKDPFRRRERHRDSIRRPKADRKMRPDWPRSEKRPGNLTDRDSSDNDDDFDFHFDGADSFIPTTPSMMHFMKSMNKDFKDHLKVFKERHMPSYSRSLSRDRGEPGTRSRDSTSRNGQNGMTRSVSRDRGQSSPETVLRFVIESPKRQTSVRSEPRTYHREESWAGRHKLLSDDFKPDVPIKNTWDTGYASDFGTKVSSLLGSPDPVFDRTSLYGTIRPKAHQRYHKSFSRDTPVSPSNPQSNRSGPELIDRNEYEISPENRRQRVETWLQMNPDGSEDKEFDPYFRPRNILQDVPENRVYSPGNARTYSKYHRSNTELADVGAYPHLMRDQQNSEKKREPTVVHLTQTRGSPEIGQERPNGQKEQCNTRTESPPRDLPQRISSQTRVSSDGNLVYTRSMSNTPYKVFSSPQSVIEMDSPSAGVRMRVSFNSNPGSPPAAMEAPVSPLGTSEGIWSKEGNPRWRSYDDDDSLSLLEALKTRGYRQVIDQHFQHKQASRETRPDEVAPSEQVHSPQEAPQRGKACSNASAESESNACCMDTNPADSAPEEKRDPSPPDPEKKKKNGEEASDGTLTPDSLDSSKEKPAEFKPKNYEEESVSERIRRKSYFIRFNDDRPKRRQSFYRDDFLPDYRSGLWSRYSLDNDFDDVPIVPTRTNRRNHHAQEKRSSANLDDYLDEFSTRRSDSRCSSVHEDFLSDDGLWGTHSNKGRHLNGHTTNHESSFYDRPGSLWTQRGRHKPCTEPSVVDTVPDLGDRRWTSRNSFSFYSPTVTPKSPVLSNHGLHSLDSSECSLRRSSLVEADCAVSEESDTKSRASEECPGTLDNDPQEIICRALDLLSQFGQD